MSDKRDVTGVWYGRWHSANRYIRPGSFIAMLSEAHSRVSGSITERNPDFPGITASSVDGMRAGGRIEFTKQYDGEHMVHAVQYAGTINGAGDTVSGSWQFSSYSGSFVMTRETFDGLDVDEEIDVRADEPVR